MPYRLGNIHGRASLILGDSFYDLERLSSGRFGPDPMDAIRQSTELHELNAEITASTQADGSMNAARIDTPVPAPRNCFAVGLNYRSHAAESGMELPDNPLVFTKFPSCLVGPHADIVLNSTTADYEAELVVVIGTGGRNIDTGDAWAHVAGLTVGQDISDRALQFAAKPPHFDLGKSRDTYGPIGPEIVSIDNFADPDDLAIECRINGQAVQSDTTANLIFRVPTLINYLSGILTLSPGDLIFTGTPEGVGASRGAFLQPDDVVETAIAGIGNMRNVCVA